MHDAHAFLAALTTVLGVAAVTTVLFHRLRQPVVLGYILAGLIVGPHVPVPLVADRAIIQTLSEIGVILLMFSLGLEFSLRKLVRVGPTAALTAVIQCSVMIWLGFTVAGALGWTAREQIFTGAIIAISSTTIIAKAFDEQGIRGRLREIVVGILIVEDLIAILLMATLTAISTGAGLSASALAATVGQLAAFLVGLVVIGLLVVPRVMRGIVRLGRPEMTLVASIGLCFGVALLALELGYSVALGAFIAGSLVAESGEQETIEHLVQPVRDMFAAIFFVSVGMMIDPALVAEHWVAVAVLSAVCIAGKIGSVALGAFLTGNGTRTSVQAGMSLAQIGEFSFIIASLGLSLKAIGDFLYPVAVAVSALTTLTTPWLIRASGPVASAVDRALPAPLQTFSALYGSWLERLGDAPARPRGPRLRGLFGRLFLDAAILAGLVIGASIGQDTIAGAIDQRLGVGRGVATAAVIAGAGLLAVPFCLGIMAVGRRLGTVLAERALPRRDAGELDLALAPRRAFVVTLQVACVLLVGLPLFALTQPFVPVLPSLAVLAVVVAVLGVVFWRSATDLEGHVRAGAQMIVEVLASQSAEPHVPMGAVHEVLPGLGEPEVIRIVSASPAAGKTLAELDLRGRTGATVLAITRSGASVSVPTAREVLRPGDALAVAGTRDAIAAARGLLEVEPPGAAT
jgi:CPA2 family monovalent cation:H+ antiporter-2